jgi:SAM-dependent methyltransferase
MAVMGLTSRQAKHFYAWFGRAQDLQAFYEDRAAGDLLAHSRFHDARAVFEVGCGTGRLAARLLGRQLPADARYLGADISGTMTTLSMARLRRFSRRAQIIQADGTRPLPLAAGAFDRFLAVYVLDLLGHGEATAIVAEARRLATARRPAGRRQPHVRRDHARPAGVPGLDSGVVPGARPDRRLPAHHRAAAARRLAHRAPRPDQRVGPHLRGRGRQQMNGGHEPPDCS